jgi:hypothetical protein
MFVSDVVCIPRAIEDVASRFAVKLYLVLRRHCYESPDCFPGQRRLAKLVGCSLGTINRLTDEFDRLGLVKKLHRAGHCLYRLAEGSWRRRRSKTRKPRKAAGCSTRRTKDRINYVDSIKRAGEPKKPEISRIPHHRPLSPDPTKTRDIRTNLLITVERWIEFSPRSPEDQQPHWRAMLERAKAALDNWKARSAEDRLCFDNLVKLVRKHPLDHAITRSLRQKPPPAPKGIAAIIAGMGGWFHGGATTRPRT